ncbi:MAG: class I SAM-dependent methyltransferase [Victivallales bacterium]|nr:class I SAM-dependent methyltransferase [Victivallales bacterium]
MNQMKYELLDSGAGRKLERFGDYVLDRPCSQAVWRPSLQTDVWRKADGFFTREDGNHWTFARRLPESWTCEVGDVCFKISPTDFGHVGVFPEHELGWNWMAKRIADSGRRPSVLNLFAYTGGATMALAKHGCEVCHLDASKKMVDWAHRNMELNHLEAAPIRWIVDDVQKFLLREKRRGRKYDGILLDPPSFGRGTNQELFKIDNNLLDLLDMCIDVLSDNPLFLFVSCHTPGYTPLVLTNLLGQGLRGRGVMEAGEMVIRSGQLNLPSGSYVAASF